MVYINMPEWQNEGTEPSEDLKTNGFQSGYKPPAGIFNWFWHKVTTCINELQNKVKELDVDDLIIDSRLNAVSWSDNSYTWSNSNIISDNQIIELLPRQNITSEQLDMLQAANIVGTSQTVGSVTFTAYGEVPTSNIPVTFIIRG